MNIDKTRYIHSPKYRSDLLGKLFYYSPGDMLQHSISGKFIEFVTEELDCLERENTFGHITASAFVVDKEFESCLLLHHKKLQIWVQPGGHIEPEDEDIVCSCRRELLEETGIADAKLVYSDIFDLDIHEIPKYKDIPSHLHFDVRFLFKADSKEVIKVSEDESNELAWVEFSKLGGKEKIDASVLRMIKKVLNIRKMR